jgi:hypothetical protein
MGKFGLIAVCADDLRKVVFLEESGSEMPRRRYATASCRQAWRRSTNHELYLT